LSTSRQRVERHRVRNATAAAVLLMMMMVCKVTRAGGMDARLTFGDDVSSLQSSISVSGSSWAGGISKIQSTDRTFSVIQRSLAQMHLIRSLGAAAAVECSVHTVTVTIIGTSSTCSI